MQDSLPFKHGPLHSIRASAWPCQTCSNAAVADSFNAWLQGIDKMQDLVRSQMESGIACLCDYFTRQGFKCPSLPFVGLAM